MNERVLRFRVGTVALVAVIITGVLIFYFTGVESMFRGKITVYMDFTQAPGVTKDTPVRKNGILIGRVTNVELLDEGGVKITAKIESHRIIRHNEIPRISTSSLLGDAVIEFVPSGNPEDSNDPVQHGDLLSNGVVTGDPLKVLVHLEDDLRGATLSIKGAGDDVSKAARNLNGLLENNEQQMQRVMQKSEAALDRFIVAVDNINEIVGDEETKEKLKQSVADLPEMLKEIRETFANTRQTLAGIDRVSQSAELNLKNLEGFTKPLGEKGEQMVADLERTLGNFNEITTQLVDFSEAINNQEGSLGKLVYDSELHDRLNRAAANVEETTRRLRPIVNDVRVFTDKIARDPRQLGVKGALDRRPSGQGFKPSFPWRNSRVR